MNIGADRPIFAIGTRSRALLTLALALFTFRDANAQTGLQLWGNVTIDWVKNDRLVYEIDFEPKALVIVPEGQAGWRNLDTTPSITFSAKNWVDLTAEMVSGFTKQTDDVGTFELTPRFGAEFHLLSRELPRMTRRERPPRFRVVLVNYFRVEWRNFVSSNDSPNESAWRFRNRLGLSFPLNREKTTDAGACYLISDFEWFLPLSDPAERFANRQRFRIGLGYRRSFNWRFEALYMWTRSRHTIEESFDTTERIIDIRVRRVF